MKCVILQPSYIPWRGYFHQIYKADTFVFYDDVQYDKRGWRNRNRIKTNSGSQWLTIPVLNLMLRENGTPIKDIRIDWSQNWSKRHWKTLAQAYGRAPYFELYEPILAQHYQERHEFLADFTIEFTVHLARMLGIHQTQFIRSSSLVGISGRGTERLLRILQHLGATHYITGPSARSYLEEQTFEESGVRLEYMEYRYLPYPQMHGPFDPHVSILDLIFMTGEAALSYILRAEGDTQ